MIEVGILVAVLALAVVVGRGLDRPAAAVRVHLTFPRTVSADQALAAARSLAGLLPPWWRRWLDTPAVTLEARATDAGIKHVLTMPAGRREYVLGALRAAMPGLRVEDAAGAAPANPSLARELRVAGSGTLRTDTTESSSAGILASLSPLEAGERALIQYVIAPTTRLRLTDHLRLLWSEERPEPPTEPQFTVAIRVGVTAASAARSRQLMARLLGSFHALSGPQARLARRLLPREGRRGPLPPE